MDSFTELENNMVALDKDYLISILFKSSIKSSIDYEYDYGDVEGTPYIKETFDFSEVPEKLLGNVLLYGLNHGLEIENIPKSFFNDKDFLSKALELDYRIFPNILEDMKSEELALKVAQLAFDNFHTYDEDTIDTNVNIIFECCEINNKVLDIFPSNIYIQQYFPEYYERFGLDKNEKFILDTLKHPLSSPVGYNIIEYASDELRNNKDFVLKAFNIDIFSYGGISEELSNDKEFILKALEIDSIILQACSKELRNDVEFMEECLERYPDCAKYIPSEILKEIEEGMDGIGM